MSWKVGVPLVVALALIAAVLLWPVTCDGTSKSVSCTGLLVQESRNIALNEGAPPTSGPSDLQRSLMLRALGAAGLVGAAGTGVVLVTRRTRGS